MSRHNILVAIDSPKGLTANQATSFVAGAVDMARTDFLAMHRNGMLSAPGSELADNLGGSVICTSVQSPMHESFIKDVGMNVQENIRQHLIVKAKMGSAAARHIAQEIIDLIMRSQLVHPEARALYLAMSGAPA